MWITVGELKQLIKEAARPASMSIDEFLVAYPKPARAWLRDYMDMEGASRKEAIENSRQFDKFFTTNPLKVVVGPEDALTTFVWDGRSWEEQY